MTTLLHLDASPRPGRAGTHAHGSHSRRLTDHFVRHWRGLRPEDTVIRRDVGIAPPPPPSARWIEAVFSRQRAPWMDTELAISDTLVDEVIAADLLVIGAPLYNFGMPANLKAWIDNIVRLDRTVAFRPEHPENPYLPLLDDRPRTAVLLTARGGIGFDPGGPLAHLNHLDPQLRTALEFIGIKAMHVVSLEGEESGGEILAASTHSALAAAERLADTLAGIAAADGVSSHHAAP